MSQSMHSRRKPYGPSGFTLNELLTVVAIVALLTAILFPIFAHARNRDHLVSCQSNLKQISLGMMQYLQDNDETYPEAANDRPECGPSGNTPCWYAVAGPDSSSHTWETSILPYLKHIEVLACPDDSLAGDGHVPMYDYQGYPDSYTANGMVSCYTAADRYTGCFCRGVMCQGTIHYYQTGKSAIAFSRLNHPEATVELSETWSADADPLDNYGHWTRLGDWNEVGGQSGTDPNYGSKVPCGIPNGGPSNTSSAFGVCGVNGAVSTHHGTSGNLANFLFCDGHVAALSPPTTDPTPDAGNPQLPNGDTYDPNNQWDATRP